MLVVELLLFVVQVAFGDLLALVGMGSVLVLTGDAVVLAVPEGVLPHVAAQFLAGLGVHLVHHLAHPRLTLSLVGVAQLLLQQCLLTQIQVDLLVLFLGQHDLTPL